MNSRTHTLALYAMLTALALILSYVESLIPAFFAVPGVKLGLTNLVVITALYLMGPRSAIVINIIRIMLCALLFGNLFSFFYSLAGGILSCAVMIVLKKSGRFGTVAVSVAGGVSHNAGQLIVAVLLLQTASLFWYLIVLWFTGLAAGAVIGAIGGIMVSRLEPVFKKGDL